MKVTHARQINAPRKSAATDSAVRVSTAVLLPDRGHEIEVNEARRVEQIEQGEDTRQIEPGRVDIAILPKRPGGANVILKGR